MDRAIIKSLEEYARLTAADMGETREAAVRAMRDEPGTVAREVGCTAAKVSDWCARTLAGEVV